mgnify:CR=1 FL=1
MKKAKTFSNIFFIVLTAVLMLGVFLLSSGMSLPSQAVEYNINGAIKVEANAREGSSLSQGDNNGNPIYLWKELESFTISFDPSLLANETEPPLSADGTYTINYTINYYTGYSNSNPNNDDMTIFSNIYSATSDDYNTLPSYTFNVDDFLTTTISTLENGKAVQTEISTQGWGVYQFEIDINGAQALSNYYYVEPDHLENGAVIEISYTTASATSSLHNAYLFSVNEADTTYKYVNKNCFVWYVYGRDYSDNMYVLTQSDTTKEEFIEYGKWLYKDNAVPSRTGSTFYFDDNGHSGNWNVYVVYEDSYNGVEISSDEHQVMTGEIIQPSTVIWIIVGVAIFVLAIVIVVIVVTVKKEKVW